MTTIAILYAHAKAQGNELRYLLRSLVNLQGEYEVVVVGDPPAWYTGKKIFCAHNPIWRYQNVFRKLRMLIASQEVSEDFVVVADDTVFLKRINVDDLKVWYSAGKIKKDWKPRSGYHKLVNQTAQKCYNKGYWPQFVNRHWPWYFNKTKLAHTLDSFGTNEDLIFEVAYAAQWKIPVKPLDQTFQFVPRNKRVNWNAKVINYNRISPTTDKNLRSIFQFQSPYEADDNLAVYKAQALEYVKDFPCVHKGRVLKVIQGQFSKKPEAVYACALLGECTPKRIDNSNRPRCLACKHYESQLKVEN